VKNCLFILALIFVGIFLVDLNEVFAQSDDSLLLSEKDSKLILREIQAELAEHGIQDASIIEVKFRR